MTERESFLHQIARAPADDTVRLVYADWLDETGDPIDALRAELFRIQIGPNRDAARELDIVRTLVDLNPVLYATEWVFWRLYTPTAATPRPNPYRRGTLDSTIPCSWYGWQRYGDALSAAEWIPTVAVADHPDLVMNLQSRSPGGTYERYHVRVAGREYVFDAHEDEIESTDGWDLQARALRLRWPQTTFLPRYTVAQQRAPLD